MVDGIYDLVLGNAENFKDYFLIDDEKSISYIPKFNIINIIVGANNSGKSRFMRQLMNIDSFYGTKSKSLYEKEIKKYNIEISEINKIIENKASEKEGKARITYSVSTRDKFSNDAAVLRRIKLAILDKSKFESNLSIISNNKDIIDKIKIYGIDSENIRNYSNLDDDFFIHYAKFKKYYIPTLRSAHSLFQISKLGSEKGLDEPGTDDYEKIEKDIFLHTYTKNYKVDKKVEIFTGLHLYRDILNSRNSEKAIRNQFEKFEKFLSNNFFDGRQIDIVAKFDKSDNERGINESELILIHVDGDRDTRKLYDLGDGIQALIVLMYKIFMAESGAFIYIDEPELNLHPGMQRLFLEQICTNPDLIKKNLKYIISTHSNHFLDLTIEKENVSMYSFSQKTDGTDDKQFIVKNVNRGDNKLLKDLGVNNSSVFMANCSIWVEGISDRNYIKAFLKSYTNHILKNDKKNFKSIKEDIDFAFFEYAGSNIDHYIFEKEVEKEDAGLVINDIQALAVSNRIFLLADSDVSDLRCNKGKRLKALEDAKSENFVPKILWKIREVENLLTNDIWKEVLLDLCNKSLVKSHKEEIEKRIEEALSEVNSSDYLKNYTGEFLENVRTKMGKISKKYILNQSTYEVKGGSCGTIINKRELSELVFNKNFSWEVLSKNKEIENLTVEIYNFITGKQ